MRKLFLISAFVLVCASAEAQYFQSLYVDGACTGNGMLTQATGTGHLMAGLKPISLTNSGPSLVRTDISGAFSSPLNFNNTYDISDPSTGNLVDFTTNKAVEFIDGSGYGSIGAYSVQGPAGNTLFGLCYLHVDATGNVVLTQGYDITLPSSGGNPILILLTSVSESQSSPGDLYACGQINTNTEESYCFIMRINQTGAVVWAYLYEFNYSAFTFEIPYDLLENPNNSSQLVVVGGTSRILAANTDDGFIMNLDANNGGVNWVKFYDATEAEKFVAIAESRDPLQVGFIICGEMEAGSCTPNQQNAPFLLKMDQAFNISWSHIYYDYYPQADKTYPTDVKGRLNQAGLYEYYLTGVRDIMSANLPDAFVMKTDAGGVMTSLGLFAYDLGGTEAAHSIDINTSGTADGISLYGWHYDNSSFQSNMYLVKAYFNGESGCNQVFEDFYYGGLGYTINSPTVNQYNFNPYTLKLSQQIGNNNTSLCYNTSISTGDNSRSAPARGKEGETAMLKYFPNPMNKAETKIQVSVVAPADESYHITLMDMLGRVVLSKKQNCIKGSNSFELDLSGLDLPVGVYNLVSEHSSGKEVNKISIVQ